MAMYAFRKNGPMPYTATSPEGDMRRHSVHMLYREWVKATLLENGLSVLLADIDISFNSSVPFFTAKEDVVLEGDWPNDFRRNWYSFKYGKKGHWTILNNGVALFTATPAMLAFSRQFMGLMVHSVVADFGFAQTSFAKHLHDLQLQLKPKSGHLVGSTRTGLSVRAFPLRKYAVHPAGTTSWEEKVQKLIEGGAWLLPKDWSARWSTINNIADYLVQ
eukprot:gene9437-11104_t